MPTNTFTQYKAQRERLTDIFRAQIVDVTTKSYIIQLTSTKDKLDAFVNTLKKKLFWLKSVPVWWAYHVEKRVIYSQ